VLVDFHEALGLFLGKSSLIEKKQFCCSSKMLEERQTRETRLNMT